MKDSGLELRPPCGGDRNALFAREYIKREKKVARAHRGASPCTASSGHADRRRSHDGRLGLCWPLRRSPPGEMSAFTFRKKVSKKFTPRRSPPSCSRRRSGSVAGHTGAPCPRCGGRVTFCPKAAKCENAGVRPDRIPDDSEKGAYGRPAGSLARQRTNADDQGLRQKTGGTFEAAVVFDGDYRTAFAFEEGGKARKPGAAKVRK